ncbi:MAG: WH2 domain-containing protein, partial [bacterium]
NIGAGTPPPPPPPSPVQRSQSAPIPGKGQGGDLLAQIRAGKQLNHVNKETSDEASQAKGRGGGSLADVLGNSPVLKKFGNPESKTNTIDPSNDEWED